MKIHRRGIQVRGSLSWEYAWHVPETPGSKCGWRRENGEVSWGRGTETEDKVIQKEDVGGRRSEL